MDDEEKKDKLKAAGKMAYGTFKVVSGVTTVAGHGIIGTMARNQGKMGMAIKYGADSVGDGLKHFGEGLSLWKKKKD